MSRQLDQTDEKRAEYQPDPAERQSPELTFSVIGADGMFKGNQDRLVFLPHRFPGCLQLPVL